MSVSIHSGFYSPGTVVRFNPTYILIPETHEGNQRVHTGPELSTGQLWVVVRFLLDIFLLSILF